MATTHTKPRTDSPITGWMAAWYARNTKRDMEEFRKLAARTAAPLKAGSDVLEVAPGPGYWAIELARLGDFRITGVDLSADFVRMASQNAEQAGVRVDFRQGNVASLPFAANSFDLILCRAAFKNFADPLVALGEMHRLLRPGGRALIIDLRNDASLGDIKTHVNNMKLGFVGATMTKLIFKHFLLKRAYSREDFERLARESPFGSCHIVADSIGLEVSLTKPAA